MKRIIGVAGPYSAATEPERKANLLALNQAAAAILALGQVPLVGINAALPVLELSDDRNVYQAAMDISMAVISACDALLLIAESPGANRERDLVQSKGLPVFYSLDELKQWCNMPA